MSARAKPRINVWKAADGWRWQYRSRNGRVQAESGEAYTRRGDCLKAIGSVMRDLGQADLYVDGRLVSLALRTPTPPVARIERSE